VIEVEVNGEPGLEIPYVEESSTDHSPRPTEASPEEPLVVPVITAALIPAVSQGEKSDMYR
jgi:hypothetical protein